MDSRRPPIFQTRQNRFMKKCRFCGKEPQFLSWHETKCQVQPTFFEKVATQGTRLIRGISHDITQVSHRIANSLNEVHRGLNQLIQQPQRMYNVNDYLQGQQQAEYQDAEQHVIELVYKNQRNLSPSCKQCAICQEQFENGDKLKMPQCLHRYHEDCFDQWLKQKPLCPICKLNIYHKQ